MWKWRHFCCWSLRPAGGQTALIFHWLLLYVAQMLPRFMSLLLNLSPPAVWRGGGAQPMHRMQVSIHHSIRLAFTKPICLIKFFQTVLSCIAVQPSGELLGCGGKSSYQVPSQFFLYPLHSKLLISQFPLADPMSDGIDDDAPRSWYHKFRWASV